MIASNFSSSSSETGSVDYSTDLTTADCSPVISPLAPNTSLSAHLAHLDVGSRPSDDDRECTPRLEAADTTYSSPVIIRNVCVIGAGYVGGPTAAVLALHNPHIKVTVIDRWASRIRRWQSGHLPIHEPGLQDVVRIARDGAQRMVSCQHHALPDKSGRTQPSPEMDVDGLVPGLVRRQNLLFSSDCESVLEDADLIMLAVNTPTKKGGIGARRATDLSAIENAVNDIAVHAKSDAIIVEKSTVPVGTAQMIRRLLDAKRPGHRMEVLSNPEFLSEGSAIKNLMNPDRVLIGAANTTTGAKAAATLASLYHAWVPPSRIITTNASSSELAKLVANAMLAQRISSINSISAICEATGADITDIARAVGLDQRIGTKFLQAGIGFGGSCFRKDVASLTYVAESLGLPEVAEYWRQVLAMNESQRTRFSERIISRLNNTLVGKKITILGFAYKKDTGDCRESLAVNVIKSLLEESPREIAVYDPCCSPENIRAELKHLEKEGKDSIITTHIEPYQACANANAVLIITEWDQFKNEARNMSIPRAATVSTLLSSGTNAYAEGLISVGAHRYVLKSQPPCPESCPECLSSSAIQGSSSIAARTRLPFDARLDWSRIAYRMGAPKYVLDGRGILDVGGLRSLGIAIEAVGKKGIGLDVLGVDGF